MNDDLIARMPEGPGKERLKQCVAQGRAESDGKLSEYRRKFDERQAAAVAAAQASQASTRRVKSLTCDNPRCAKGLLWTCAEPPEHLGKCGRCGESFYCGGECQAVCFNQATGGVSRHRPWCGKLLPPPAPLRLIHHLVSPGALIQLFGGAVCGADAPPPRVRRAYTQLGAVRDLFYPVLDLDEPPGFESIIRSGVGLIPVAKASVSQLDALLGPAVTRAVLIVRRPWVTDGSTTLFDVSTPDTRIDAAALIRAATFAMNYMFREEDRLTDARYGNGLSVHIGSTLPPGYASKIFAITDENDRVTSIGVDPRSRSGLESLFGMTISHVLPPRLRWATRGPFECGEDAPDTIALSVLHLFRPGTWPPTWVAVEAFYTNFSP
jgi:hypothetical protein